MIKYMMQILNENDMVTNTYKYKYHLWQKIYLVYENFFGKYKVKQEEICGAIYTNIPSYHLSNGWIVSENDLFNDEDDAVQRAMYLNQKKKILH